MGSLICHSLHNPLLSIHHPQFVVLFQPHLCGPVPFSGTLCSLDFLVASSELWDHHMELLEGGTLV